MKRLLLIALLATGLAPFAAPQSKPAPVVGAVPSPDASIEVRQRSFDVVWRTVKEKHFDPTFGGVDWDKVRAQYEPQVAAVKSDAELYAILQKMLGELHQSHFNIIPPEAIVEDDAKEPPTGGVGISLSIVDGLALITRVEPESAAARAGIRSGFVVRKVDQTPVEEIAARFAKSTERPAMIRLRLARTILARINGKPGTAVRVAFADERNRTQEVTLERQRLNGEMSPRFGNFPAQYTEFEAKRLAGGIGYIRFNIFVMPLMERIRSAIRSMKDAPGIIFDIRGNPGGLGGMSSGIAGLLAREQTSLGRMTLRSGYQNFAVFPQKDPYTGPLVILIEGGSASTSEVFSAGMQEIGRAVIVGERSVGAALPSVFEKLPTGALFQYAIADFRTPKGTLIEGRGVIPDLEVKLSRETLLRGRDIQLDAAIRQIKRSGFNIERTH
ncbi:MAG TPA: S41 family peptidase [Blastocatellia bacterium]|nr:S41 family peptidase [Blastocatellia bacterium]